MRTRRGIWQWVPQALWFSDSLRAAAVGWGGVAADGTATVVWSTWGTADELTRYQEFNKDFMERHPDITVKLQPVAGYGDYHSKLLAQLTSNTAPDVFYVGDDMIGQFVDSNRLMPLDDLMASKESKTKKDDFFPGLFGPPNTKARCMPPRTIPTPTCSGTTSRRSPRPASRRIRRRWPRTASGRPTSSSR
ncbi:extracellular solute-binding protein [Microbacterium sp. Y-01]|uniref:extracellular solute-binding protein n=1 Tax=Microbacterium sp. Y-01 TaxID=2048898 RepID=UPI0013DE11F3|nr:extracellular solute-binding protein [Microbacterium sp. Y-01]